MTSQAMVEGVACFAGDREGGAGGACGDVGDAAGGVPPGVWMVGLLRSVRRVRRPAIEVASKGGCNDEAQIGLWERGAYLRQNTRKVVIINGTQVLLAQPVDDLDKLGAQAHPGADPADLPRNMVHEPAHDLVRDIQVSSAGIKTHCGLPRRVLVGDDRSHQGSLLGNKVQFQVPGIIENGVHRSDRVVAVWVRDSHSQILPAEPVSRVAIRVAFNHVQPGPSLGDPPAPPQLRTLTSHLERPDEQLESVLGSTPHAYTGTRRTTPPGTRCQCRPVCSGRGQLLHRAVDQ